MAKASPFGSGWRNMAKIDFDGNKPKFLRPELLRHGQIPRPMAGVAPRVVLGQDWWDIERRKAYAANNYCCWACGSTDMLEAHEIFDIDYLAKTMTFVEISALCSLCHAFIHIGRTRIVSTLAEFKKTVLHGHKVLRKAKLKANWGLRSVLSEELWAIPVRVNCDVPPTLPKTMGWSTWRMIIAGNKYPPKFRNELE
jgi:hypothetical protein